MALLFIDINSSTFTDPGYAHRLAALTCDAGLAPERLVIEVLESGGTDVAHIARATRSFRAQGFLVAVDDFGAEHSNIDRLLTLKPDIVKLDRGLIRGTHHVEAAMHDPAWQLRNAADQRQKRYRRKLVRHVSGVRAAPSRWQRYSLRRSGASPLPPVPSPAC
ncbi:EAL domain [Candidatus Burkholderia pumila]|uniref:EAL domain n=1 Tax=Candidatus Burkholderia pumila TaxID=1090375 RepID=A0ABR5HLR3_9BURK|nr:EAL domain [Candidatus Burkholderia pumila]